MPDAVRHGSGTYDEFERLRRGGDGELPMHPTPLPPPIERPWLGELDALGAAADAIEDRIDALTGALLPEVSW